LTEPASRFCTAFDELRQYFQVRRRGENVTDHPKAEWVWRQLIEATPVAEFLRLAPWWVVPCDACGARIFNPVSPAG